MAKKKTPGTRSTNKSAFIRALPADMPAADVVAKAKAAGLVLSPAFVYAVRSKAKGKKPGGAKGGRGRPATGGKPTASDFVRTQPASMGAAEVVAAGAKQGFKFSTNLVYAVRSAAGKGKVGRGKGRGRGAAKVANSGSEATFRKLALDLGLGRARQALDDLERGLAQLIGH
jgi:hypothetical protein